MGLEGTTPHRHCSGHLPVEGAWHSSTREQCAGKASYLPTCQGHGVDAGEWPERGEREKMVTPRTQTLIHHWAWPPFFRLERRF